MNLELLAAIFFALMVMQVVGTHLQVREYRKAVRRLHSLGNLGIGAQKRRLGPGAIVMIACKGDGRITGAEIMQGMTILTRFRKLEGIDGRTIWELEERYLALPEKRRKHYRAHLQAIDALKMRLSSEREQAAA